MKKIDPRHAVAFIVGLVVIAILMERTARRPEGNNRPQSFLPIQHPVSARPSTPDTGVRPSIPTPAPQPKPSAPIARIWPADYKPTKTIVIPDPEHPTTGALSDTLRLGDDFEMIFAQQGQTWFLNKRIVRFRLKSGTTEQGDILFDIQKVPEHKCKPLPTVDPVNFGKLKVTFDKLQSQWNNTQITVDLSLENTDKTKSIAVALSCTTPQYLPNSEKIRGNLVAEDGSEYWLPLDGLTGIRYMNSNPEYLMEIAPSETRRISLRYKSYRGLTHPVSSFRLRSEIVINPDYHDNLYPKDYKSRPDVLPPGCKIESLLLDIPVRELKNE